MAEYILKEPITKGWSGDKNTVSRLQTAQNICFAYLLRSSMTGRNPSLK